jgi:hypothetical protein
VLLEPPLPGDRPGELAVLLHPHRKKCRRHWPKANPDRPSRNIRPRLEGRYPFAILKSERSIL